MKKPKKGAANGKPSARKQSRAVEIIGLLLLFLAIFSLISLVSYDSKDPSFANVTPGRHVTNFAGHAGAYFADALLWFLGFVVFLLPFGIGYVAVKAVLRGTGGGLLRRLGLVFLRICRQRQRDTSHDLRRGQVRHQRHDGPGDHDLHANPDP